ncbi:c-type cytochrome [Comamonas sp.]|uniref:c-type cytochrome n=1 Tax=Comamonas sp. TaxID=34028 RepID=UPI00289D7DDA|nr:c-type cytochrome [Comamonas sp.]
MRHTPTRMLRRIGALWPWALLLCAAAQAQTANPQQGEQIANNGLPPSVASCASCHGAKGQGMAAFPPLAGQGSSYLRSQLEAFADGSRGNPIMAPIAKGLTSQQRADVAAYFASLPSGIAATAGQAGAKDKGAWLVERGRMQEGIPACNSCHGPGGAGVGAHFPAIAKLSAGYMQAQIDAWKKGSRPPGPLGLMEGIAQKLSSDDVNAIAQYYAGASGAAKP